MAEIWGALAGAAIAGSVSLYSAKQQEKAAQSTQAGSSEVYGRRANMPDYQPVGTVGFNPEDDAAIMHDMLPYLASFASKSNKYSAKMREKIMPGFGNVLAGAGETLNSWMRGQVPDEVQDSTMRSIAEKFAGVAGQGSVARNDFARAIGKIGAIDLPGQALSLGPNWLRMADSFVMKPQEAFAGVMDFIKTRYGILNQQTEQEIREAENMYTSEVNQESSASGPNPAVLGLRNDAAQAAARKAALYSETGQQVGNLVAAATRGSGGSKEYPVVPRVVGGGYDYTSKDGFKKSNTFGS